MVGCKLAGDSLKDKSRTNSSPLSLKSRIDRRRFPSLAFVFPERKAPRGWAPTPRRTGLTIGENAALQVRFAKILAMRKASAQDDIGSLIKELDAQHPRARKEGTHAVMKCSPKSASAFLPKPAPGKRNSKIVRLPGDWVTSDAGSSMT